MRGRDLSLTIALCASLVVHGLLCWSMISAYAAEERVFITKAQRQSPSTKTVEPDPIFGELKGQGSAPNSWDTAELFSAKLGDQSQAFLSRDPVGPGKKSETKPPKTSCPKGKVAMAKNAA